MRSKVQCPRINDDDMETSIRAVFVTSNICRRITSATHRRRIVAGGYRVLTRYNKNREYTRKKVVSPATPITHRCILHVSVQFAPQSADSFYSSSKNLLAILPKKGTSYLADGAALAEQFFARLIYLPIQDRGQEAWAYLSRISASL
jgi:hypothetical protein